jgi:hypothetical protein
MITTRIAAAFAAAGLAVGILAGSAGTIVILDATTPNEIDLPAHMSQMGSMMSMMASSGGMMSGSGGMMSGSGGMMSGSGGMMNGQTGTTPTASGMPDPMQQHHVTTSPAPSR